MDVLFSDYGIFDEQHKIGPIQWPHYDLLFIHQGVVEIVVNNTDKITLAQDQGIIIFPNTHFSGHTITKTSKGSAHHFQLEENEFLNQEFVLLTQAEHVQRGYIVIDTKRKETLRKYITDSLAVVDKHNPALTNLAQHHLLSLFFLFTSSECNFELDNSNYYSPEQKIAAFLARDLKSNYSLEAIASLVHLSPSHVRRIFKRRYKVGPNKYHMQLKLEEACRLLDETNEPIKSIYHNLGFNDLSNFYRAFRKYTGLPPALYRKKALLQYNFNTFN